MTNETLEQLMTREQLARFYRLLVLVHADKIDEIVRKEALSGIYMALLDLAKDYPKLSFSVKYIDGKLIIKQKGEI